MLKNPVKRIWMLASALLVGSMLAGTSHAAEPLKLKITTGGAGGIFFIQGGIIAQILKKEYPGSEINVFPGGAVGNLAVVSKGIADIGLTHLRYLGSANKGELPYKEKFDNVVGLMKHGYYAYGQVFVSADTGIKSLQDIKEKKYPLKLATTGKGGASYWTAMAILGAYGITEQDLKSWGGDVLSGSFNDHVSWFRDGQVNAWGGNGQLPTNAPLQISQFKKIEFLSLDEPHADKLMADIPGNETRMIPAGTYPKAANGAEPIRSIVEPGGIIIRKDLPVDVVYKITKALCENWETVKAGPGMHAFDPKTAWKNVGGPLHPGAVKYFKERGWMN